MSAPAHWDELKTFQSSFPIQESDLRQSINSPTGLVTLWVLVEGDADPYFYERMFDNSRTKVVKVGKKGKDGNLHGGFNVVKEIVANFLALGLTPLIIGIIDRDWRPFKKEARLLLPPHVFETDQRDLEMTFLSYQSLRVALKQEVTNTMNTNHIKWFRNGFWYQKNGDWFRDVWERCCKVSRYMGSLRIVASYYENGNRYISYASGLTSNSCGPVQFSIKNNISHRFPTSYSSASYLKFKIVSSFASKVIVFLS